MFDIGHRGQRKGDNMREELRNGSSEGIILPALTLKQKILLAVLVCIVTGMLTILPNIL
jgi:hypothetical protein